jgi:hypothetical protein
MEQITRKNYFIRLEILHLLHQPVKILFIHILWNGNARLSEVTCFAKVKV